MNNIGVHRSGRSAGATRSDGYRSVDATLVKVLAGCNAASRASGSAIDTGDERMLKSVGYSEAEVEKMVNCKVVAVRTRQYDARY